MRQHPGSSRGDPAPGSRQHKQAAALLALGTKGSRVVVGSPLVSPLQSLFDNKFDDIFGSSFSSDPFNFSSQNGMNKDDK